MRKMKDSRTARSKAEFSEHNIVWKYTGTGSRDIQVTSSRLKYTNGCKIDWRM